jgi:hypothetical protein
MTIIASLLVCWPALAALCQLLTLSLRQIILRPLPRAFDASDVASPSAALLYYQPINSCTRTLNLLLPLDLLIQLIDNFKLVLFNRFRLICS